MSVGKGLCSMRQKHARNIFSKKIFWLWVKYLLAFWWPLLSNAEIGNQRKTCNGRSLWHCSQHFKAWSSWTFDYELQLFGRLNSNYPSLKQQLFVHSTYFRLVKLVQEIIHTYNPINYSEMMMHLKMNQLGGHYTWSCLSLTKDRHKRQ